MTTRECIKVDNLRKKYSRDYTLEKWLQDPNNIYIGRNMTFYVKGANKSIWANPFQIKKCKSIDDCLDKYREFILGEIKKNPEVYDLNILKGKNLGCWCLEKDKCHADVLISLLKESL
jgi:hypothetical protein